MNAVCTQLKGDLTYIGLVTVLLIFFCFFCLPFVLWFSFVNFAVVVNSTLLPPSTSFPTPITMTKPAPKKLRKINVGHLNTYHLVNKVPDLTAYLRRHAPFHLFGISETRLGDHITDDIINIPNYTIVRRDPVSPRETGLAVYIHNSIHHLVKRRKDLESKVLDLYDF